MSILNRRQDENITPTPPLENKTSFIPTPLASAYVTKVTDDFKSTKADHARAGREVVEQHKSVTEYYVNLIKSTKLKAVRVIDAHKLEIYKAKTDYDDLKTKTEIEIAELKEEILQRQSDISNLEAKYVGTKFVDAVEKHNLTDEIHSNKEKLAGEKFQHAVDHKHDEKAIQEKDDKIQEKDGKIGELEEEVEAFKLKVDVLKQQLEERCVKMNEMTSNFTGELKSQEMTLAEKETMLSTLGDKLLSSSNTIFEKEEILRKMGVDLDTKDKTLEEKEEMLSQFGRKMQDQEFTVEEKQKMIEEQKHEISHLAGEKTSLSQSLSQKETQLAALNDKIENDEETKRATEESFNSSIDELKSTLEKEERTKEKLRQEFEDAKQEGNRTVEELEKLKIKLSDAEAQASSTATTVTILESQVATFQDSQSEMEAKLQAAEHELEDAQEANEQSEAAKTAQKNLSILQMSAIEKAEEESAERARQLDEASNKMEELKMQVTQCKSSAQTAEEKAKLLNDIQKQMEETRSYKSDVEAKLKVSEFRADEMRDKFEKRLGKAEEAVEEAKTRAEELKRELEEARQRGEDLQALKVKLEAAELQREETERNSTTLATQLETVSLKEADTEKAKADAEENIRNLEQYVNDLQKSHEEGSESLNEAQQMLNTAKSKAAVLEAKLKGFEAKNAADQVMFAKLQQELSEQEENHRVALSLAEDQDKRSLEALRTSREDDMKKASETRKALEDEATGLSEKLSDLSREFLENENQGIVARKAFEKKVKGLIKEVKESKGKAASLSEELEMHAQKAHENVKQLQEELTKAKKQLKDTEVSKGKVESRLKQVEWLRSEEMKKYGFSGRTVKKKKGKAASTVPAREPVARNANTGGGGGNLSRELNTLKVENAKLKKELQSAKQNWSALKARTPSTQHTRMPSTKLSAPPLFAPTPQEKKEAVNEAKREYQKAKEELKAVDGERKSVKDGIKKWLAGFEEENGHTATSEDKEEIMDKYKLLKELEGKVKELKEVEKGLKGRVKELKEKEEEPSEAPPENGGGGGGAEFDQEGADLVKAGAEAAKAFTAKINLFKKENEELKEKIEAAIVEAAEKEVELLAQVQEKEKEVGKAEKEKEDLKEKLEDIKKNGDAMLKSDAELAEKKANQYKEEMLAAKTLARKAETGLEELKERAEGAEGKLKVLRKKQPKSGSEEVNELRKKVQELEKKVIVKGKASIAGWEKLAEVEEECEKKLDEVREEGVKEGEERAAMKLTMAASQVKTIKNELEYAKEKVEKLTEKGEGLKEKLGAAQRQAVEAESELNELRKKIAEEAAEVGVIKEQHTPRGGGGGKGKKAEKGDDMNKKLPEVKFHDPALKEDKVEGVMEEIKAAIKDGTKLWKKGKKKECFGVYKKCCEAVVQKLGKSPPQCKRLYASLSAGKKQQQSAGAVTLRKALDAFVNEQIVALAKPVEDINIESGGEGGEGEGEGLGDELGGVEETQKDKHSKHATPTAPNAKADPKLQQKVKKLEDQVKKDKREIERLKEKLAKADQGAKDEAGNANNEKASKRMAEIMEKKFNKKLEEEKKKSEGAVKGLERKLKKAEEEGKKNLEELERARKELKDMSSKAGNLAGMQKELDELRGVAGEVDELRKGKEENKKAIEKLNADYGEEKALRKKYWNMMEDMKGKIRVYARCRPFNKLEKEQDSEQCVRFIDDTSLELNAGARGLRDFTYDGVFSPSETQAEVYEDTSHLITSAIDGYNVCLFAYGQTGSGKTWTMTGDIKSEENQGITPRAMKQLFAEIKELSDKGTAEVNVSSYFVELYNDQLVDLYYKLDHKSNEKPPKLEIKLDAKKSVVIKNCVVKEAGNFEELNNLFDRGNRKRHVGATRMNAGSSRSHSIFSILIESKDLNTGQVSLGKLTLVDLAGSERADKTGATGERLHEATSINTSLSALGDVISALCRNDKFIPYRNNKLTQVMQDSLGGNAKTLMFVNISPADYNASETMSALEYASRVKQIKNTATKAQEGEEVARLNDIIKRLKSGEEVDDDEIAKIE
ncbi:hypothetical protein TrLO_g10873 [Triparma laevis f. longispina]|nr:hypothetical protein TrLO_g10873 [Triparma laevis f. longispina]